MIRVRMTGRASARRAILALLLASGVILGLLGMHALNLHGTGSAHDASSSMAADVVAAAAEGHAGAAVSSGHSAPVEAAPCADCAEGHSSAAMLCVLALLFGILLLVVPPAFWRTAATVGLGRALPRTDLTEARPRAPSLHLLCISRR